ncbi:MAG: Gfo/Idh/MocA family oxidoreductase [Candidatus Firestonebacteria bacterium]
MKIGILSFAHMHAYSYAHCVKLNPNAILVGVADDDRKRGQDAAKRFKTKYFSSFKKLLEQDDLEAVIICSENVKHKELTEMCAHAKKHILCEKPIATNIKDAIRMIEVCKNNNVKLQIAFPCRFIPSVVRAKRLVNSGEIGKILAIRSTNHGKMPGGWFINKKLAGGGAVMDHTVHVVDLMRWFLKREVKKVYAEVDKLIYKMKIDDCGTLMMEFENGVFASLDPSWSRPKTFPTWGDLTMKIIGEKGIVSVDAFSQNISVYDDKNNKYYMENWGSNYDVSLIKNFIDMILYNKEPFISGYDGLKALEVALAAYISSAKKKVVELPL